MSKARDIADSNLDSLTVNGNVNLGDNDQAIFGAGSDLKIYHDGSHSIIQDAGTGDLILQGGNDLILRETDGSTEYLRANEGAGVQVFHNGSQKLLTTSTGIDVTGTVTADDVYIAGTLRHEGDTDTYLYFPSAGNTIGLTTGGTERMRIDSSGNVGIGTSSNLNDQFTVGTSTDGFTADVSGAVTTIRLGGHSSSEAAGRFDYNRSTGLLTYKEGTYDSEGSVLLAVTNSGKVGIGTSSPLKDLVISNGGAEGLEFSTTDYTSNMRMLAYDRSTSAYINLRSEAAEHEFYIGGAEKMRIDSTGDVLIGTTSAYGTNVLNVNGGIAIDGRNASTPGLCEKGDTNTGIFWPAADTLAVTTNGTEAFRVNSDQEIIANRYSASDGYPAFKIRQGSSQALPTIGGGRSEGSFVLGMAVEPGAGSSTYNTGTGSSSIVMKSTYSPSYGKTALVIGHQDFQFYAAASSSATPVGQNVTLSRAFRVYKNGNITAAGTVTGNGAYINSSDERLKENIQDYGTALAKINSLRVVNFDWINADQAANQGRQTGFLAQEVQDVAPELVVDTDIDSDEDYLGINVTSLLAITVKALQEANSKIETLEAKVSALEGN